MGSAPHRPVPSHGECVSPPVISRVTHFPSERQAALMTSVLSDSVVLLDTAALPDTDASGGDDAAVVRIVAADLSVAQNRYRTLRETDPDARVFVDVDVHLAADARTARREVAESGRAPRPDSLQYVGTATGLISLIADIVTVRAADGVTVRPVIEAARADVVRRVVDDVIPGVAQRKVRG